MIAFLVSTAIKSLLLGGSALLVLKAMSGASAAKRSVIAHGFLMALLVLAIAPLVLPAIELPLLPPETVGQLGLPGSPATPGIRDGAAALPAAMPRPERTEWFIYALAIPTFILLAGLLFSVAKLFFLRRNAEVLTETAWLSALAGAQRRMNFKDGAALLVSADIDSPLSYGFVRPVILLDIDAASRSEDAEALIAHELAHVARGDWVTMLMARIVLAILWFNPFVWRLVAEAHQLREEAADDAVLRSNVEGDRYAELLVRSAKHASRARFLAAHGVAPLRGSLSRRVAAILDPVIPRDGAPAAWVASVAIPLVAASAFLSAATPTQAQPRVSGEPQIAAEALQFTLEDMVALRNSDVTEAYQAGILKVSSRYAAMTQEEWSGFYSRGVTAANLAALHDAGFGHADFEALEDAVAFGADPSFIREVRSGGYKEISLDDLVEFRIHGVDGKYIRSLMAVGFNGLRPDELARAAHKGMTADYVRSMRQAGFDKLPLHAVLDLLDAGVTADDVRAFAAGRRELPDPRVVADAKRMGIEPGDFDP